MAKGHHTDRAYGLLALLLVVAGVLTAFYLLNRHDTAEEAKRGGRERAAFVQDSLQQAAVAREEQRKLWAKQKEEREKKRAEWERRREEREKARAALDTITVRLVPFDPNKTDSSGFVHLGLKPWMARSVCRYVEKGGRFRKAEDFRNTNSNFTNVTFDIVNGKLGIEPINATVMLTGTEVPASRADVGCYFAIASRISL